VMAVRVWCGCEDCAGSDLCGGVWVFSTMRVTQRGSQRYMEKRRGRRELEVTRMR